MDQENNKPINPIKILDDTEVIKPIKFIDEEIIDPEKRIYVLLYYYEIDGKEDKTFEILKGRTKCRQFIIDMIECMDIHESVILVDGVSYGSEDMLNVYKFMKAMETHYVDGFDIEEYNIGDDDIE